MNTGRYFFSMVYLNGFYYALGGRDYQGNTIKKCERYSLSNNTWQNIAELNNKWYWPSFVSIPIENCIYLMGNLKIFEKYDQESNKWTEIQVRNTISSSILGCFLLPESSLILIIGGLGGISESPKKCYFYDYETNQLLDANPMPDHFYWAVNMPVELDDKIYCYSIWDLLIYDIKSGVWYQESL